MRGCFESSGVHPISSEYWDIARTEYALLPAEKQHDYQTARDLEANAAVSKHLAARVRPICDGAPGEDAGAPAAAPDPTRGIDNMIFEVGGHGGTDVNATHPLSEDKFAELLHRDKATAKRGSAHNAHTSIVNAIGTDGWKSFVNPLAKARGVAPDRTLRYRVCDGICETQSDPTCISCLHQVAAAVGLRVRRWTDAGHDVEDLGLVLAFCVWRGDDSHKSMTLITRSVGSNFCGLPSATQLLIQLEPLADWPEPGVQHM